VALRSSPALAIHGGAGKKHEAFSSSPKGSACTGTSHQGFDLPFCGGPLKLTELLDTPGLQILWSRMTESEIEREVKRRMAVFNHAEEVTGNVAMTCRYLRDHPPDLLRVEEALRGARRGGSQTALEAAQGEP
jgi:hypothetical protein